MACLALAAGSCATTTTVTPELVGPTSLACTLEGAIAYEGNPEFLPRVLVARPVDESPLVFRYSYRVDYALQQLPAPVQLINPLNFVGFPTGANSVVVMGRLQVMRGGLALRSYAAAAGMRRTGTMFSEGETLSEMRRRGLLLVRDNISRQLCSDREHLLASPATGKAPSLTENPQ